jgi:hypothetical protein
MNKIFCLLLTLIITIIVISLSSCSKNDNSSNSNTTQPDSIYSGVLSTQISGAVSATFDNCSATFSETNYLGYKLLHILSNKQTSKANYNFDMYLYKLANVPAKYNFDSNAALTIYEMAFLKKDFDVEKGTINILENSSTKIHGTVEANGGVDSLGTYFSITSCSFEGNK